MKLFLRTPPLLSLVGFLATLPAFAIPLALTPVPDAYLGSAPASLLPPPQEARLSEAFLSLEGLALQAEGPQPELQWALRDLSREVQARFGTTLATEGSKLLRVGTLEHPELAQAARERGLTPDKPEGYALWVEEGGAAVVGFDALGAYRGAQTLRQLLTPQGFRFAQVRDWPAFGWRMAMIYLDKDSRAVNDVLVPLLAKLKYSHVLVMSDYVQWNSSRALWHPSGAPRAEAERVVRLIREHGMEPVPLLELLSHAQWLFYNPQTGRYDANKDLWADPEAPNSFAYDPLVPRVYEVVLPILSEVVEVFKPRYVHIGHDELTAQNRFPAKPEAVAVGLPRLFVDDTLRLYNHLKGLGVGTMIWHDVAFSEAYREQIAPALPKDIVVAYWNYSAAADYPLLGVVRGLGFGVLGSSWYNPGNPESMAQAALRYGANGVLQTRWSGYFGNATMYDGQAEQAVAYFNAASAFWNPPAPGAPPDDLAARYRQAWRVPPFTPIAGQLVDLGPAVTRRLADPDETQWIQKGPSTDLSALPSGVVRLGPYRFHVSGAVMLKGARAAASDLPQSVTLELGGVKARALAFLHTTGWIGSQRYERVGSYTLTYADGSKATLPLEYGRHLTSWLEPQVRTVVYEPVWRGRTQDGLEAGLNVLVWNNPKPDQPIQSLTLESSGAAANPTLVGLTLLERLPGAEAPR
ncbi:glycoside hydrolase family 20 zincin-like fold domain-containing protein [Calidithermus roseus]|uniref:beta-N-acetylhexosaminidase n=1 Tax=Calidithermus roseus TaxID=1644118 RepID=A0A399EKR0_9DEIN|nr:glycoside hydrolase family 20 zincin-like fold domain-containing protein [Calidithermus roseus]RIH85187.1 Glycosyl hydrolase family 20, domain 2 [Calidithermus roseus]